MKTFGEDFDVLRTYYMDTLNINNTIQYANRLKEQRERARAAEEARLKAGRERKEAEEQNVRPANPFARMNQQMSEQPAFIEQPKTQPAPVKEELLTRAFKVTTTRENIIALGDFMNERGIDFDKIEI